MKKNKNKVKELALKFFVPACAIMLWYPGASVADTSNIEQVSVVSSTSTSNTSGLRDTEIMLLKMIHERKMFDEHCKTQKAIAKELSKKSDFNSGVFMTDTNFYNDVTKIRKA